MSEQYDLRWTLSYWAWKHNHSPEEAIDLVDNVEGWSAGIGMAYDEAEAQEFRENLQSMIDTVLGIYDQLNGKTL